MPPTDVKRGNYFIGQFLEAKDFLDEQSYHIEMRRRRNRAQYGTGVLEGLTLTKTAARQVTVAPGTAIDTQGRELVLLIPQVVDAIGAANATVYVTINYLELQLAEDQRTRGDYSGYVRITERPQSKVQTAAPPTGSADLLLASVQLDASSNITTVTNTVRQMAQLNVNGDLVLEVDRALKGKGRLRIGGDDRLEIQNRLGVLVTKAAG